MRKRRRDARTQAEGFSLNFAPVRILAIALSQIVNLASIVYGAVSVHHLFSTYVGLDGGVELSLAAPLTVRLTVALLLLNVTSTPTTPTPCAAS